MSICGVSASIIRGQVRTSQQLPRAGQAGEDMIGRATVVMVTATAVSFPGQGVSPAYCSFFSCLRHLVNSLRLIIVCGKAYITSICFPASTTAVDKAVKLPFLVY